MCKILIADDERALRVLIAGTLEIGDYDVLEADFYLSKPFSPKDLLSMVEEAVSR